MSATVSLWPAVVEQLCLPLFFFMTLAVVGLGRRSEREATAHRVNLAPAHLRLCTSALSEIIVVCMFVLVYAENTIISSIQKVFFFSLLCYYSPIVYLYAGIFRVWGGG